MRPERLSRSDAAKFQRETERDIEEARHDARTKKLVETAVPTDQWQKALTGRKFHQYEAESGIREAELFPEGKATLNIGDPWQVLDREGITTLEYETGEEAEFVTHPERFLKNVPDRLASLRRLIEEIGQQEGGVATATELAWRLNAIEQLFRPDAPDMLLKHAAVLADMKRVLEERRANAHADEDRSSPTRGAWYAITSLLRGCEDIAFRNAILAPERDRLAAEGKFPTDEELQAWERAAIAEYRGRKKYTHASLVKGAYPDTPFPERSFDRIVASWSISTHMFAGMEKRDFETVWNETDRLLKPGGAAYFWPLTYGSPDQDALQESLKAYQTSGGDAGCITSSRGLRRGQATIVWLSQDPDAFAEALDYRDTDTLILLPRGANKAARERVRAALIEDKAEEEVEELPLAA